MASWWPCASKKYQWNVVCMPSKLVVYSDSDEDEEAVVGPRRRLPLLKLSDDRGSNEWLSYVYIDGMFLYTTDKKFRYPRQALCVYYDMLMEEICQTYHFFLYLIWQEAIQSHYIYLWVDPLFYENMNKILSLLKCLEQSRILLCNRTFKTWVPITCTNLVLKLDFLSLLAWKAIHLTVCFSH